MIDTTFLSIVGFGGIVGFLIGFMLKKVMKILAVVAWYFLGRIDVSGISGNNDYQLGETTKYISGCFINNYKYYSINRTN